MAPYGDSGSDRSQPAQFRGQSLLQLGECCDPIEGGSEPLERDGERRILAAIGHSLDLKRSSDAQQRERGRIEAHWYDAADRQAGPEWERLSRRLVVDLKCGAGGESQAKRQYDDAAGLIAGWRTNFDRQDTLAVLLSLTLRQRATFGSALLHT